MSQFNYPRINFSGNVIFNPGTGDNDDYSLQGSGELFFKDTGLPFRVSDTPAVQAITRGMSDEEFLVWMKTGTIVVDAQKNEYLVMPSEWNYYGDMSVKMKNVNVVSVNLADGTLVTDPAQNELIGASVSFNNANGMNTASMTDNNPEDNPCTQIFANFFSLIKGENTYIQGKPSKSFTRWINFLRNTNLHGDAGAAGYFQCVVPSSELSAEQHQYFSTLFGTSFQDMPHFKGWVIRFDMYRSLRIYRYNCPDAPTYIANLEALMAEGGCNLATACLSGTIAPWYEGELKSIPLGRILNPPADGSGGFPNPSGEGAGNNDPLFLAPTVLQVFLEENRISLDISNTFPETFVTKNGSSSRCSSEADEQSNLKTDLGEMWLRLSYNGNIYPIAPLPYVGDYLIWRGGMADIDISQLDSEVKTILPLGDLEIYSVSFDKVLLYESEYFITTDQGALYADQYDDSGLYLSDEPGGEPCLITILRKGVPIKPEDGVTLYVQEAQTSPNYDQKLTGNTAIYKMPYAHGIKLGTQVTGNMIYRFCVNEKDLVSTYSQINLITDYYISLRILPRHDFSKYLDPKNPNYQEVTWEIIYNELLRNYYLIYPAMAQQLPFNDPTLWNNRFVAQALKNRINPARWNFGDSMPPTRDLSTDGRLLIMTWCDKIINGGSDTPSSTIKNQ